jgi:hypothetical protein
VGRPKIERVGIKGKNSFDSIMEIVQYNNNRDLLVKFEKGNTVHSNWRAFCKGEIRNPYDKSVYKMGFLGEGEYKTQINRKQTPQYKSWSSMLYRCYNSKYHEKQPTYIGCTVSEEWLNYQNFAKWYDQNYYEFDDETMHLEKDILIKGNKVYSPETSLFVPQFINNIFVKSNSTRGDLPIGVTLNKRNNKCISQLIQTINGVKTKSVLGTCLSKEDAFYLYKKHKENYIKQIAEEFKDKIPEKLYDAMLRYEVEITD